MFNTTKLPKLGLQISTAIQLPHLVIVIPAYNEGPVIASVIKSLPKIILRVGKITTLVVNDGSKDNTAIQAEEAGAIVVSHPINLGVGSATQTGFKAASKLQADVVITMDADGQHSAENIEALITPIINLEAQVVFGNRFGNLAEMPITRNLGNRFLSLITKLASGISVQDSQCGFRAYNAHILPKLVLHQRGYEVCSEIICEVGRNRLNYAQVPVKTIYDSLAHKKSQDFSNAFNIILRIFERMMWR